MSAKAMISSRFASISRGVSPRSAAARSMFASPCIRDGSPIPARAARRRGPPTANRPARGLDHAGHDLEECRLPGAILADDAQRFAALQLEADAVERAKHARGSAPGEEIEHEANPAAALLDLRVVFADIVDLE
jgi:hypothetical protein